MNSNQSTIQLAWMTFWDVEIVNLLDCDSQQGSCNLRNHQQKIIKRTEQNSFQMKL